MQSLLFESAVRATLIAAVVAMVLYVMRIKTASARHAVWSGVVLTMLLLPAWLAWGPRASLTLLPSAASQPAIATVPLIDAMIAAPRQAHATSATPQTLLWNWPAFLFGVYLLGVFVLLSRLAIGTIRTIRLTSASCIAPVTVGFFRPRIILPEGSIEWPQARLDAVLVHEREHARRRDPLVQWIALLNRALFWFHPLAWWLERRLSGLAEEACDTAVLAHGHDPHDYSEYLLDLSRSVELAGKRLNFVGMSGGMAMPGTFLPQRIRRMLSGVPTPRISRPRMACTAAACAAAAAILAAGTLVRAQTQAEPRIQPAPIQAGPALEPPLQPPPETYPPHKSLTEELAGRVAQPPGLYIDTDQEEHRQRMAYANDHFSEGRLPGWGTGRGQVYVRYGPPDSIDDRSGAAAVPPYQVWHYRHIEDVGDDLAIEFVDPIRTGEYREALGPWTVTPLMTRVAGGVTYRTFGALGLTIEVRELGQTTITISFQYGVGPFEIHGTISSDGAGRLTAIDERSVPLAPYTSSRPLQLLPGSYKLELSINDLTTGAIGASEIPFQVE